MKAGDALGGKYKLIQRLGKGAMGVVWEAVNERTGRRVALKLIDRPTDDLRHRLLHEARACGSLNHPNIVEVYDVGETDDNDPFLVMQLFTGETLAETLERKKRIEPYPIAARIGRDIASALDAAHSAKIIHRDLKPANIFLHREPDADESTFTVKVLDFGVSKSLKENAGPATQTGLAVGSPAYMSPEQVRMMKGLDYRTDIWSLGIILHEMLTGVRPFGGRTIEEVVHQIMTAPIPLVSNRVRSVPQAFDEIVARCLERDRDKRIQDAKSLARSLGALAEVSSVSRVMVNVLAAQSPGGAQPASAGRPPMGSTPDIGPPSAARTVSISDALSPTTVARPAMSSSPSAAGTLSDATTLPWQRPPSGGGGAARPGGLEPPEGSALARPQSPTGTHIIPSGEPVAPPMPAWRAEMQQALAASRKAPQTQETASPEALVQGGTLAFAPDNLGEYPTAGVQSTGVTTTNTPMVQAEIAAGAAGGPGSELGSRKRKRGGNGWLFAMVGVGVAAAGLLVVLIAVGVSSSTVAPEGALASAGVEHVPAPTALPSATAPPVVEAMATAAPTEMAAATAIPDASMANATPAPSATPVRDAAPQPTVPGPLPAPKTTAPARLPGPMPKPWCSKVITTNCRPNNPKHI